MNTAHPNYGLNYRLMRAALRMGSFTVSELQSLTGAGENTVYSFIGDLEAANPRYFDSKNLSSEGRGRPKKRYSLTDAGTAYVTKRVAELASRFEPEPAAEVKPVEEPIFSMLDFDLMPAVAGAFAGIGSSALASYMPVNVYEFGKDGQNLLVRAEIPGVVKDDLDVLIENNILVISGKRRDLPDVGKPRRVEVRSGPFRRSFILPSTVDPKTMRAEFGNGVLNVLLNQPSKAHEKSAWRPGNVVHHGSVYRASIMSHSREEVAEVREIRSNAAQRIAHRSLKATSG